jgi:hypothetical protein
MVFLNVKIYKGLKTIKDWYGLSVKDDGVIAEFYSNLVSGKIVPYYSSGIFELICFNCGNIEYSEPSISAPSINALPPYSALHGLPPSPYI